jgi:hypothetical protein
MIAGNRGGIGSDALISHGVRRITLVSHGSAGYTRPKNFEGSPLRIASILEGHGRPPCSGSHISPTSAKWPTLAASSASSGSSPASFQPPPNSLPIVSRPWNGRLRRDSVVPRIAGHRIPPRVATSRHSAPFLGIIFIANMIIKIPIPRGFSSAPPLLFCASTWESRARRCDSPALGDPAKLATCYDFSQPSTRVRGMARDCCYGTHVPSHATTLCRSP